MPQLYAYFGHHKCASSWIHQIVNETCKDAGLRHIKVSNSLNCGHSLASYVIKNKTDFLSYTNAVYSEVSSLKNLKAFHVIRDPRDVLVSGYFSHLKSHPEDVWPELSPHREKLNTLSPHDGLLEEFNFSQRFLNEMGDWDYTHPDILQLKMEDMIQHPYTSFLEVFAFLGILDDNSRSPLSRYFLEQKYLLNRTLGKTPFNRLFSGKGKIPSERLLGNVHQKSFKFLSGGRNQGVENSKNHYRKGVPGDWQNYFTQIHAKRFIELYGNLLIQLGYEEDHKWIDCLPTS
jgi:hypothetical protein